MRERLRTSNRLLPLGLGCYLGVVLALTLLKALFRIGDLWQPANQRVRQLRWVPLDDFFRHSWFKPVFEYGGNLCLFVPLGILLYLQLRSTRRAVAWCAALSGLIEATQYVFALGRTDIDDLLFNTLGAFLGALLADAAPARARPLFLGMPFVILAVFLLLL